MNGISFILSSGHEAPHHKCMMDASAQSEFSTHEALSVISHAKEREATKFVATTVCPNKFWLRSKKSQNPETQKSVKSRNPGIQKSRNPEIQKFRNLEIYKSKIRNPEIQN